LSASGTTSDHFFTALALNNVQAKEKPAAKTFPLPEMGNLQRPDQL
jgi:hypothetical protein